MYSQTSTSIRDIPGCLLIEKAQQILNEKHNESHELLLIFGYTRQNIKPGIPDTIKQTFHLLLGSMHLIIADQIEYKIAELLIEINIETKQSNQLQKHSIMILNQMIQCGIVATKQRAKALTMSNEIEQEMKQINARTTAVESELAEAKPALEAAQKAVSNIRQKELRCVLVETKNPSKLIHLTFSAVFMLMDYKIRGREETKKIKIKLDNVRTNKLVHGFVRLSALSLVPYIPNELTAIIELYTIIRIMKTKMTTYYGAWKRLQRLVCYRDLIPLILKFDANKIKEKTRKKIQKYYLSNEDFTFKKVNRTSRAVGPLVLWVKAQVKFAHLLDSVEPMTREIKELKEKLISKQKTALNLNMNVELIEEKFESYKDEYKRMVRKQIELENEINAAEKFVSVYSSLVHQFVSVYSSVT